MERRAVHAGVSVVRRQLQEALRRVPEPCSIAMRAPMDIVEMGLVGDLRIGHGHVIVELVLTDPSCAHFRSLQRFISDALLEVDSVDSVEVVLSTRTLWTPDRVRRRPALP
jgi:metal-sulfur cluster biosynthetic enzyme